MLKTYHFKTHCNSLLLCDSHIALKLQISFCQDSW